jgi:Bacterial archaeo-eukaryotic release factor family 3
MHSLINDYAAGLLDAHENPCLSLYQPTHRCYPENQQHPIRFRNLVKSMEQSLRQKCTARAVEALLDPFLALADDRDFWNHTLDGLAVLAAPGLFRVYRLQRLVPELVVVADTFHIKPLMRVLQSADRYQVLGLNRREIKLYEGNRDALDEIDLAPGIPRTITEALGEEITEPHMTVASYGMGAGGPAMRHSHGSKKDELDKDLERFFRAADRAVLQHHSKPSGLPLILAALTEYHSLFRQVSQNPFLMADGIDIHPDALPGDALRDRAWRVVEPQYLARLAGLVEEFGRAKSKGLGSDELAPVAEAAVTGRVATLLIEAEGRIPGRIDYPSGRIEFRDLAHPEVDDLLDDVGELVVNKGGQVVIVPADRMPTRTGIAAIYRF